MNPTSGSKPVAVVTGAGPGNGAAIARRFAEAGYRVALLARSLEPTRELARGIEGSTAYACDVGDPKSVTAVFKQIRDELGEADALIYNAGSGVFAGFEDITAEQFEQSWRVNALGSFLCAKEVVPAMKAKSAGAIILIGATASRRGGPKTAAFAPAKAAQRVLGESMAKTLGPQGIHVALIVIDGVIETPKLRERMPDKPAAELVDPAGVAEAAFQLVGQSPRAWSFEIDLRPSLETW